MQALKPHCGKQEFTTALNNIQRQAFTVITARYPEAKIEKKKKEKERKDTTPKTAEATEATAVVAPSVSRDSPTKKENKSVGDVDKMECVGKNKEDKNGEDKDEPAVSSLKRALSPTLTRAAVGTTAEATGSNTKDELGLASLTKDTKIENATDAPMPSTSSVKAAKTENTATLELPATSSCVYEENLSRIKGRIKKSSPCLPDKQITLRMQLRVLRRELSTLRSLGPKTVSKVLEEIIARESSGKRLKTE